MNHSFYRRAVTILIALILCVSSVLAQDNPTTLTLILPSAPISVGSAFDITVLVRSNEPIDAVGVYLTFDPAAIQVNNIVTGAEFPVVLQNVVNNAIGTIDFAAGRLGSTTSGELTAAIISATAIAPVENSMLRWGTSGLRRTDVASQGYSILDAAPDMPITILSADGGDIPMVIPTFLPPNPQPITLLYPFVDTFDNGGGLWTADLGWALEPVEAESLNLAWRGVSSGAPILLTLHTPIQLPAELAQVSLLSRVVGTGYAEVQASVNGVSWLSVGVLPVTPDWTLSAFDLSAFAGSMLYVRVQWLGGEGESALLIDDVRVEPLVVALPPPAEPPPAEIPPIEPTAEPTEPPPAEIPTVEPTPEVTPGV